MPKPSKPDKLSANREVFAREFVRIGNGSRAYRAAYKVKPDTKPESVWVGASKLLADPKVAQRVAELKADAAKRAGITVENRIAELETNLSLARELEQVGAANQAILTQSRLAGLLKDDPANRTLAVTINIDAGDKGLL
jgi:hypothetical protein